MSDSTNTPPDNADRPRTRFQQPGGLPPIASTRATRPVQPSDVPSDELPVERPTEPRPFPPEVTLYAAHPSVLIDRLRTVYAQSALSAPPPTRWNLGVTVTIPDADIWDQVQAATADSLRDLLPLTIRVIAVAPTVRNRQDYAAGWTIEPNSLDDLRRVRASAIAAIQSIVPDLAPRPLDPALTVAESVPALAFPTLIATMQHDFAPFTWSIDVLAFMTETEEEQSSN